MLSDSDDDEVIGLASEGSDKTSDEQVLAEIAQFRRENCDRDSELSHLESDEFRNSGGGVIDNEVAGGGQNHGSMRVGSDEMEGVELCDSKVVRLSSHHHELRGLAGNMGRNSFITFVLGRVVELQLKSMRVVFLQKQKFWVVD